jgi:hypothetical protein
LFASVEQQEQRFIPRDIRGEREKKLMCNRIIFASRLVCLAGLVAMAGRSAPASVLTFEVSPDPGSYRYAHLFANSNDGAPIAPIAFSDYGDRVAGASESGKGKSGAYTYTYGTAGGATTHVVADYLGNDAGNDVVGYNYGMDIVRQSEGGFDSPFSALPYYPDLGTTKRRVITLTADPGYYVSLQGFKLQDFFGQKHLSALDVIGINADNSTTSLWTDPTPDAVFGSTSKTYTTTDFGGPIVYRSLAIEFTETADNLNYFAFTNIQFSEVVPEPASLSLLAVAGLIITRRR